MSTTLDLYCKTCDSAAGISNCHQSYDGELSDLLQRRSAFASPVLWKSGLHIQVAGQLVSLDWLQEHATHGLGIRNGYGQFVGACGKWVRCPTCRANSETCVLEPGHAGDCRPLEKKGAA
jgi:hypothetical protein